MKLKKFTKNKKQKRIVIGSIVGILLLIGGFALYKTFALYKVEQSFDVLKGTVPPFMNGDLQLAVTVDGNKQETIPTKDKNYGVVVSCDNAKGSWDYNNWQAIIGDFTGSKIKCNLYFESTFSGYIKALANVEIQSIIKEEHEITEQTPKLTDYRYVGATPNNYVCLEEGECSDEQLYRIIGVMPTQTIENGNYEDRVKVIKNTNYAGDTSIASSLASGGKGYYWSGSKENDSNNWNNSTLYTKVLNEEYWASIKQYQHYIEDAKWYLGAFESNNVANKYYSLERSNTVFENNAKKVIAKIGLMYVSDYTLATAGTDQMDRKTCLENVGSDWYQLDCKNGDWLYDSLGRQWTINTSSLTKSLALTIGTTGIIVKDGTEIQVNNKIHGVRPTFFLKTQVQYKSGDGSYNNPYHITIVES